MHYSDQPYNIYQLFGSLTKVIGDMDAEPTPGDSGAPQVKAVLSADPNVPNATRAVTVSLWRDSRKLDEQPADVAGHEHQGRKDADQHDGGGDHGEEHLPRAALGRDDRRFALVHRNAAETRRSSSGPH